LSLAKAFEPSLLIASKAGSFPIGAHLPVTVTVVYFL
jgi:hypothetical protein